MKLLGTPSESFSLNLKKLPKNKVKRNVTIQTNVYKDAIIMKNENSIVSIGQDINAVTNETEIKLQYNNVEKTYKL